VNARVGVVENLESGKAQGKSSTEGRDTSRSCREAIAAANVSLASDCVRHRIRRHFCGVSCGGCGGAAHSGFEANQISVEFAARLLSLSVAEHCARDDLSVL
jgi:hypothetical protein